MLYSWDWTNGEIEILEEKKEATVRHFDIFNDHVRFPDGNEGTYVRIQRWDWSTHWVVWIVSDWEGKFLMIKEFRHASRRFMWNLVEWGVDIWETPEQSFIREVKEETWWDIQTYKKLWTFIPLSAYLRTTQHVYHWTVKHITLEDIELGEAIVAKKRVTIEEIDEMVKEWVVCSGITISALYFYKMQQPIT